MILQIFRNMPNFRFWRKDGRKGEVLEVFLKSSEQSSLIPHQSNEAPLEWLLKYSNQPLFVMTSHHVTS